jgi:hypothetical protein
MAPDWLTTGITYLLPKSGDSKEVRNYRPITCLTTMYKTLTGIIAKRISTHLEEQITDRHVVQNEAEKKLKYRSLCIEIQRMWNLKCTIIPVIIGATGIVTRSLRRNLEAVPGKHSIDSLQKTAILGT